MSTSRPILNYRGIVSLNRVARFGFWAHPDLIAASDAEQARAGARRVVEVVSAAIARSFREPPQIKSSP